MPDFFGGFSAFVFEKTEQPPVAEAAKEEGDEKKEKPTEEEIDKDVEDTKKKGKVAIEAAARVPVQASAEKEPGKTEDVDAVGGEIVGRYVLSDPTKPYIALTFPLAADYRSLTITTVGAKTTSELADEATLTGGVGIEGGLPLGSTVTLYGGAGVEAGAKIYDYSIVDTAGGSDMGTDVTPVVASHAMIGLRVSPVSGWHLHAGVKPTITFTGGAGLKVPVVVGTGISF